MRFTVCIGFGILALALSGCGPDTAGDTGADELGASESESSTTGESETGEPSGPTLDPEEQLACWEPLGDVPVLDAWGLSTEQLLLATIEGMARVEGDSITHVGSGASWAIWATDLDNGWLGQDTGLVRIVDGALEPWPDLAFEVRAITGLGPSDVWASGVGDGIVLAHYDGATWTTVDPVTIFGGSPDNAFEMVATADRIYISSNAQIEASLLVWDGATGSLAPPYLDNWEYIMRISTRDGQHPLVWMQWCDFGCYDSAYELVGDAWAYAPRPQFDDWKVRATDYHADPSGGLWALAVADGLSGVGDRRITRHHEGAWQRARVPSTDSITDTLFALPDGAVVIGGTAYRATSACLFGE